MRTSSYLSVASRFVQRSHDEVVGRTAVRVDEHNFAGVHSVHGDQLAYKDLVWAVGVENFKFERQRISYLGGRLDVAAAAVGDLHGHVGRVDDYLLADGRPHVSLDAEVDLVRDGLVGEVVLAGDGQAQVGAGDDGVVVLDDDVVEVFAEALVLDVAFDVVVRHLQLEFQTVLDVLHARVGAALGVDLAVEQLAGLDFGDHVTGSAVDGHIVA